jgi:hypothetical protein
LILPVFVVPSGVFWVPVLVVVVLTPRVTEEEQGVVDIWRSVGSNFLFTDVESAND